MKFLPMGSVVLYVPLEYDYTSGVECITNQNFTLSDSDHCKEVNWRDVIQYKRYNNSIFVSSGRGMGYHIYFQEKDVRNYG